MPEQQKTPTGKCTLVQLMCNFASYNLWANTRLVDWLRKKDSHLFDEVVPSSFPSLKLTLIHIWHTERYWCSILKKIEPVPYNEFDGTIEELFVNLLAQSAELAAHIHSMSVEQVEEKILIISPWFQSDLPGFEYLMHAVNHSTYHRGQLTSMGRNLGFTDAPMTDYNFYNVNAKGE